MSQTGRSIPSRSLAPPHPLFSAQANASLDLVSIKEEFDRSGFVVLEGVLNAALPSLTGDLRRLIELQSVLNVLSGGWPEDIPTSDRSALGLPPLFHPGHGGASQPRTAPWLTCDLVANPTVEAVVSTIIGPDAALVSLSGNTAFPGCGTQYLHVDSTWRHKTEAAAVLAGQPWPLPTTSVVVNWGTEEMSIENGATELWPGSHNDPSWARHDRSNDNPNRNYGQLEMECPNEVAAYALSRCATIFAVECKLKRRLTRPPIQPFVPLGAVLIRDMRLWHRGVQNLSDVPRAMFALVYTDAIGYNAHVEFFGNELAFSPSCKEAFAGSKLAPPEHVRFSDDHTPAPIELTLGVLELQRMLEEAARVAAERPWTNYRGWMEKALHRAVTALHPDMSRL